MLRGKYTLTAVVQGERREVTVTVVRCLANASATVDGVKHRCSVDLLEGGAVLVTRGAFGGRRRLREAWVVGGVEEAIGLLGSGAADGAVIERLRQVGGV